MSEEKRKRSPNWLPSEKELLLGLVEIHHDIIENKKTDGVTVKSKLAQWQIIADQYNSRTTHCVRTGENLKCQWESMKKVARKDAATARQHIIQTGGGPPIPLKKEDPFLQRILSIITTSAVGLFNPYDSDSLVPVVQDQAAIPVIQTEDFPDRLPKTEIVKTAKKEWRLLTDVLVEDQKNNTDVMCETQENMKKDWGDYTPPLLRTPLSRALKMDTNKPLAATNKPHKWISRRRPTHTSTMSSLELLHKKKIEALELQNKLAVEEMEWAKALHEIDIQVKKEKLRQEKINTHILLIRKKKLLSKKKGK